jgi:hypothetical protein
MWHFYFYLFPKSCHLLIFYYSPFSPNCIFWKGVQNNSSLTSKQLLHLLLSVCSRDTFVRDHLWPRCIDASKVAKLTEKYYEAQILHTNTVKCLHSEYLFTIKIRLLVHSGCSTTFCISLYHSVKFNDFLVSFPCFFLVYSLLIHF